MECPECSWLQLQIAILFTIIFSIVGAFLGILLIKYPFKPNFEKRFDKNELNVHVGVMGFLNSFDSYFKFFYDIFEHRFGQIQNLEEGEWLPNPYQDATINETGGFDLRPKSQVEYEKVMETHSKLKHMDKEIFQNYQREMESERKRIQEYMDKNELYLDPLLRRLIEQYLHWTIFYMVSLKSGWHYTDVLKRRFTYANQIIEILNKEKNFKDIPHIDEFIKKWNEYDNSE